MYLKIQSSKPMVPLKLEKFPAKLRSDEKQKKEIITLLHTHFTEELTRTDQRIFTWFN